jgi:hypothetical protein
MGAVVVEVLTYFSASQQLQRRGLEWRVRPTDQACRIARVYREGREVAGAFAAEVRADAEAHGCADSVHTRIIEVTAGRPQQTEMAFMRRQPKVRMESEKVDLAVFQARPGPVVCPTLGKNGATRNGKW